MTQEQRKGTGFVLACLAGASLTVWWQSPSPYVLGLWILTIKP